MIEIWRHFSELKQRILDQFNSLMSEDQMDHEMWLQQFQSLSHVISETSRYESSTTCENLCKQLSTYLSSILHKDVSFGNYQPHQRMIVCLMMLKSIASNLKTIPFAVLETLLAIIEHKVSRVPLPVKDNVFYLHDLTHFILCQLHRDPRLHNQVNLFFEKHQSKKPAAVEQNHWKIIEEHTAVCGNCSAKHGPLTPAAFGGVVVKRTATLFEIPSNTTSSMTTAAEATPPPSPGIDRKRKRSQSPPHGPNSKRLKT
jgi:hypothetical protein